MTWLLKQTLSNIMKRKGGGLVVVKMADYWFRAAWFGENLTDLKSAK